MASDASDAEEEAALRADLKTETPPEGGALDD